MPYRRRLYLDSQEIGFLAKYRYAVHDALDSVSDERLSRATDALYDAWLKNKTALFCGNGGSGSSCSHIVNDFQKNIGLDSGKPLRAICLNDATALVSAWANDSDWGIASMFSMRRVPLAFMVAKSSALPGSTEEDSFINPTFPFTFTRTVCR
jgi:hypothetical protein